MRLISGRAIAERDHVVALQREIVEACGVAAPAGRLGFVGANDMSCGAHLHAAATERTLDQSYFQLDGGSGLQIAGRQKIDSAGADVAGYQRDRNGLGSISSLASGAAAGTAKRADSGDARERRQQREWERARIFAGRASRNERESAR